jgi:hypothetical protein
MTSAEPVNETVEINFPPHPLQQRPLGGADMHPTARTPSDALLAAARQKLRAGGKIRMAVLTGSEPRSLAATTSTFADALVMMTRTLTLNAKR